MSPTGVAERTSVEHEICRGVRGVSNRTRAEAIRQGTDRKGSRVDGRNARVEIGTRELQGAGASLDDGAGAGGLVNDTSNGQGSAVNGEGAVRAPQTKPAGAEVQGPIGSPGVGQGCCAQGVGAVPKGDGAAAGVVERAAADGHRTRPGRVGGVQIECAAAEGGCARVGVGVRQRERPGVALGQSHRAAAVADDAVDGRAEGRIVAVECQSSASGGRYTPAENEIAADSGPVLRPADDNRIIDRLGVTVVIREAAAEGERISAEDKGAGGVIERDGGEREIGEVVVVRKPGRSGKNQGVVGGYGGIPVGGGAPIVVPTATIPGESRGVCGEAPDESEH